jgi:hypothetical protein
MSDHLVLSLPAAPASHPHLLITTPEPRPASGATGTRYHVSLTLPDAIFIDRHELIDLWAQAGRVDWKLTPGTIDIERPVSNTTEFSTLRVSWSKGGLDVPLHVRYLEPNDVGSKVVTLFQKDDVKAGWGCADINGEAVLCSPAKRQDVSCLSPVEHTPLAITLPAGRFSDRPLVELATPVIIWLGWIYLAAKIWALSKRTRHIKTD